MDNKIKTDLIEVKRLHTYAMEAIPLFEEARDKLGREVDSLIKQRLSNKFPDTIFKAYADLRAGSMGPGWEASGFIYDINGLKLFTDGNFYEERWDLASDYNDYPEYKPVTLELSEAPINVSALEGLLKEFGEDAGVPITLYIAEFEEDQRIISDGKC